jgi:hypothetical protein
MVDLPHVVWLEQLHAEERMRAGTHGSRHRFVFGRLVVRLPIRTGCQARPAFEGTVESAGF